MAPPEMVPDEIEPLVIVKPAPTLGVAVIALILPPPPVAPLVFIVLFSPTFEPARAIDVPEIAPAMKFILPFVPVPDPPLAIDSDENEFTAIMVPELPAVPAKAAIVILPPLAAE